MSIEAPRVVTILSTTGATTTGGAYTPQGWPIKFLVSETGTGAITATVLIEVTNTVANAASWVLGATVTLSGTTDVSDSFVTSGNWGNVRARTTAISGTGATVTVTMGY